MAMSRLVVTLVAALLVSVNVMLIHATSQRASNNEEIHASLKQTSESFIN